MAEGAEGEDEIQFLRTVSKDHFKGRVPLSRFHSVRLSFLSPINGAQGRQAPRQLSKTPGYTEYSVEFFWEGNASRLSFLLNWLAHELLISCCCCFIWGWGVAAGCTLHLAAPAHLST